MNKNSISFHKDTTSRLVDSRNGHSYVFVPAISALLFTLAAYPQLYSLDGEFCKCNKSMPNVEWKFNSAKKLTLASESVRLHKRLIDIVELCAEDEDIMPIGESAIKNMKCILVDIKDALLKRWNLFPNNNGTLSMEYKEGKNNSAAISIGYKMISYSLKKGDDLHIIGMEPFSFSAVESLLIKMA